MANCNSGAILAIGYGNALRGDDGAGCHVSDIVATWHLPYVRSLTVHQLTPELAEPVAESELTIFIDAFVGNAFVDNRASNSTHRKMRSRSMVQVQKITPPDKLEQLELPPGIGHLSEPRSLLFLAKQIYGKTPVAYSLLLPATNWEFGEQLSTVTRKGIEQAVDFLRSLCTRLA